MKIFLISTLLFAFIAVPAFSQDLDEAEGLEDKPAKIQPDRFETIVDYQWKSRSYVLIETTRVNTDDESKGYFPNLQWSLTSDFKRSNRTSFFLDGVVNYYDSEKEAQGVLNQAGFRLNVDENWQVAMGRERNRRSPGIIVSPSDIIYTQSNLPGQREDRRGAWLGRASYQDERSSYDLIAMPAPFEREDGFPDSPQDHWDSAFRTLQQFDNVDVSFSFGNIDEKQKAGLAVQGIFFKSYKFYYEIGFQDRVEILVDDEEKENATQQLLGMSFEGSNDYSYKVEYYRNEQGYSEDEFKKLQSLLSLAPTTERPTVLNPFLRQQYLILTAAINEIKNEYNLVGSVIKSLDDDASVFFLRGEWLINDKMVAGVTALTVGGNDDSQYALRPLNQQYTADLKYTF